ncbi:MAG TPA: hypothetical protein VFV38_28480 [Ktedonobacteraceae bacterium]|nr:hypothetical protein [Ktedonobacteraceae bacterium]
MEASSISKKDSTGKRTLTVAQQRERVIMGVLLRIGVGMLVSGVIVGLILLGVALTSQSHLSTNVVPLGPSAKYHYPPDMKTSGMQELSAVSLSQLRVAIITPQEMKTGQTYPIVVLLIGEVGNDTQVYNFFTEQNGLTTSGYAYSFYTPLMQPSITGVTGNSLADFFGKGYSATAPANLIAPYSTSSLSSTPPDARIPASPSGERSLDTYGIIWEWDVTPQNAGQQILNLDITAKWAPQPAASSPSAATPSLSTQERQLLLTSVPVPVSTPLVYPSLQSLFNGIDTGLTGLGTALVSTATITMLINWCLTRVPPWEQGGGSNSSSAKDAEEPKLALQTADG